MSRFLAAMYRDLAKEFRLEAKAMQAQAASLERQANGLMRGVDFFQGKNQPSSSGRVATPTHPRIHGPALDAEAGVSHPQEARAPRTK